ncbi:hypothetical protein AS034_01990 [[Bacillus] enclensis]|uniref:DNA-binding transcriptional regulator, XRE family n=1 Tax=[Bacillus] enclensis TaxID=1402860 RepID=A0A0V8HPW1_9BACI|nr:helix-turn-helix transcriptional regulator [[Bacillus] enclensis]KSU64630.1 hypothetical protein AS034_01990 [[Bacillus] enclensis]SCB77367.1 DNA-binding transcriptional regulator, XRE family [[Bacillus] enclensis]
MNINYKGLWKILIDRDMSKSDLRSTTGIAASTFTRMYKNEYVSLEVLARICIALKCQLSDIVEVELCPEDDVKSKDM